MRKRERRVKGRAGEKKSSTQQNKNKMRPKHMHCKEVFASYM